ncbi:slipin family protein [Streptacidiphilus neutrinimicus]|uniref:slipin family protein n=1 Tax=Streptacidiphilus neutrinimicus TaxID=105420 RepID=UPI000A034EF5
MLAVDVVLGVLGVGAVWLATGVRVVQQFERGVVFRFGKVRSGIKEPGLTLLLPVADRLRKVNVQIITMPVPAQEGITRDNVTVRVDAVVYFRVEDPVLATVQVQNYTFAMSQVAQTSLRSIIGKSELDDLLTNREPLNQGLELMLDSPAVGWGIHIDRVEIKDVALPESMKRSMSRQAEAERERRARIITADGEFQASRKLSEAATIMSDTPAALQLRLLQTVVEVAAEKNSTLVLPFPVELLRFLDGMTPKPGSNGGAPSASAAAGAAAAVTAAAAAKPEEHVPSVPPVPSVPELEAQADAELEAGGLVFPDPEETTEGGPEGQPEERPGS